MICCCCTADNNARSIFHGATSFALSACIPGSPPPHPPQQSEPTVGALSSPCCNVLLVQNCELSCKANDKNRCIVFFFPATLMQFASGTNRPSCTHEDDEPHSEVANQRNLGGWGGGGRRFFFSQLREHLPIPHQPFLPLTRHSACKTTQVSDVRQKEQMKG